MVYNARVKTLLPILFVVILAGCGPENGYAYRASCVTIYTPIPLDMGKVDLYVRKAQSMFEKKFGAGMFCPTVRNSLIVVRDEDSWNYPNVGNVIGLTDSLGNIELSRNGSALLHEAIHVYEMQRWRTGTTTHTHWGYLGYNDMDKEFATFVYEIGWWLTP